MHQNIVQMDWYFQGRWLQWDPQQSVLDVFHSLGEHSIVLISTLPNDSAYATAEFRYRDQTKAYPLRHQRSQTRPCLALTTLFKEDHRCFWQTINFL